MSYSRAHKCVILAQDFYLMIKDFKRTKLMAKIIAVANQKGGVGKTTTTVNLTASLALVQKRALLIDLDPQGNATMGCYIDKHELELSVLDVLLADADIKDCIQKVEKIGFDVLPANSDLTAAEVELMNIEGRELRLRNALAQVADDYDYIVIDCPPSLNMLTLNALVSANGVLIPMQCEYYALEGLSSLIETIDQVKSSVNPNLKIEGLVRTMYDPRNKLSTDVSAQLIEHFGDKVFNTVVPRNVRLAEAPSHGLPIINYDRSSKGALAYFSLAGEVVRRVRRETKAKRTAAA
ncbi:Chromosome (plasmid) partitioning protein ParA [hydrothermal vent metagenome]|uniref:Chromosome (Plasmid) partitioning protein ParA n=1 Tax=hydrothermal vent metagenome TaxID=652676 RepID=A0A3B0WHT6_9ZZZZ